MRKFKTALALLLTLALVVQLSTAALADNIISDTCGDNLTWVLNTNTGVLTISGTGEMENYELTDAEKLNWSSFDGSITAVVIEDGVTSVILSDSIASLGWYVYQICKDLTSVTIPVSLISIGKGAFAFCRNLSDVYYAGSEAEWNAIEIGSNNDYLTSATIHYNSTGNISSETKEATPCLVKSGEFHFVSEIDGVSTYTYDYDENWFFNDSYSYQHDLVKMSVRVSMASFGINNSQGSDEENAENILALMDELEFSYDDGSGKYGNSYSYPVPDTDTIGYAIGSKNIQNDSGETCTLIMVAVRSGGYANEWGGNFRVGSSGSHEGFQIACDTVLNGLENYIENHEAEFEETVKIWISGYSRGAATVNLVAAALDDGRIDNVIANNVFAFCFACPQATTDATAGITLYKNIVNIVNPVDLVPMVAPTNWGFTRYGTSYYLPSSATVRNYSGLSGDMLKEYLLLYNYNTGKTSGIMEYTYFISYQDVWFDDVVGFVADTFRERVSYTALYQYTVMNLAEKYFADATLQYVDGAVAVSAAVVFVTELLQEMKDIIVPLNIMSNFEDLRFSDFLAALESGDLKIMQAHYPELMLYWIDAIDGTYVMSSANREIHTTANTRKVYFNCPIDISVYDSDGILVAEIIGDEVQEVENGIPAYIDMNGQKVICMPTDGEYDVVITATDDGELTYTATEYNLATGETTKVVSYQEISITQGEQLSSSIGNTENSSVDYVLTTQDDVVLTLAVYIEGEDITNIYVEVNTEGNGAALGGGNYINGEFALVTATPASGAEFVGWYNGDECISTEEQYRFLVTEDISLTAVFEGGDVPGDLNDDGEVDASDLTILARHVGKVETMEDEAALANADVTGDGNVDASDLTKLAQYVGKIISSLD